MNKPTALPRMRITTGTPPMGSGPIPASLYTDAAQFEREREGLFRGVWLELAREELLPSPGDYLVVPLEILNTEVILVRGRDGTVRAFHNVCTHRGNQVTRDGAGNTRNFVCGYHGWTFDTEGNLKSLPGEAYFPDAKRAQLGLQALACDIWNGFIYVNSDPQPAKSLRAYLGTLADDMEGYPFASCQHIARYDATVKVNWKAFTDAFREGYHVAMVHGQSIPDSMNSPVNPQGMPNSCRFHGPHFAMSTWGNPAHKPTPSEALAWQYGMTFTPGEQLPWRGINPSGDDIWWFDMNMTFPNFWVALGPGWYFTYNFWPVAVDRTRWTMNIYQMKAADIAQRIAQEHTKCMLRDLLYEDLSTLESTQRGMASGVIQALQISDDLEISIRHQHWAVEQVLEGKL